MGEPSSLVGEPCDGRGGQIVIPHSLDQHYWGARVHSLGVGPAPIIRPRLTAEVLRAALDTALRSRGVLDRATRLGEQLAASDGIAAGVRTIEDGRRA